MNVEHGPVKIERSDFERGFNSGLRAAVHAIVRLREELNAAAKLLREAGLGGDEDLATLVAAADTVLRQAHGRVNGCFGQDDPEEGP